MFRLLKYALIFFLGYKIIKTLFGQKAEAPVPPNQPDGGNKHNNNFSEKKGDYIDFEEIKK